MQLEEDLDRLHESSTYQDKEHDWEYEMSVSTQTKGLHADVIPSDTRTPSFVFPGRRTEFALPTTRNLGPQQTTSHQAALAQ